VSFIPRTTFDQFFLASEKRLKEMREGRKERRKADEPEGKR
jgi:hypothetical protein